MSPNESPSVSVPRRGSAPPGAHDRRTVVWLRGEHDIATRVQVSGTIDQATRLVDADIVVDLSGVTFMDASTIGALVAAHNRARGRSRELSVRAPSPQARRVLDLCGLAHLTDGLAAPARTPTETALGSWVDVPASERRSDPAPTVERAVPGTEPVRATALPLVEPAGSINQRPDPS